MNEEYGFKFTWKKPQEESEDSKMWEVEEL